MHAIGAGERSLTGFSGVGPDGESDRSRRVITRGTGFEPRSLTSFAP
ncbi:hypothetical protein [Halalkalirubrum salinum]|nr:hypothetical protein [Halalkalirubrum salinum]